MQSMANLIDSALFRSIQLPVFIDGVFFQEVTNFISRCKEIIISNMVVVRGSELGFRVLLDIKIVE